MSEPLPDEVEHYPICDQFVAQWQGMRTCYCDLIRLVRTETQQWIVAAIMEAAFDSMIATDGKEALEAHNNYEGLVLAAQIANSQIVT